MAVNVVWALNEAVKGSGAVLRPGPAVPDSSQVDPDGGRTPSVSLGELYRLCEQALLLTSDEALGLHWGERDFNHTLSLLPQVVHHAESLGQAIEVMLRFSMLLTEDQPLRLVEQDDKVLLVIDRFAGASPTVWRMLVEFCLSGIYRVVQTFRDDQPRQVVVCFDYEPPPYRGEYARVFAGTERFGQSYAGILLPRELMYARSRHRDRGVFEAAHALAERRLSCMTASAAYSARVRSYLMRQPAPNRVSMNVAARELDVSVRSLHRRLAEERTSYTELAHEAAGVVATQLVSGGRSIKEAAYIMGFADPNSFHRAFKRWTGRTPGASR